MKENKPSFLQYSYATYSLVVFVTVFLILYPFMFVFVQFKSCRNVNHWLYRIWGYAVFFLCGIRWRVIRHFSPKKGQSYVYCANHTSYMDIPSLYCTIHEDLSFIGKSSLGKAPLFGSIYSKIHILVDRRSANSRYETITKSKEALDNGSSLVMFPEGTIPKTTQAPEMIEFKDGAFKIAIEKQVPIVPVIMPYNYYILPDTDKFKTHRHVCKIIFLTPIETHGFTLDHLGLLKKQVFNLISDELRKHDIVSSR